MPCGDQFRSLMMGKSMKLMTRDFTLTNNMNVNAAMTEIMKIGC